MSVDGIQGKSNLIIVPFRSDGSSLFLKRSATDDSTGNDDVVNLSKNSQEFIRVKKMVDAQPDFRMGRVYTLAKAIHNGTYNTKGEVIADAIVRRNLIDLKA